MASQGYKHQYEMQNATPFLAIKSVREFYGASLIAVGDGYTGYAFESRYESFGANLQHIVLVASFFDAKEFAKFIKPMSRLKTFRFSYEMKWHACGYDCDAGAIVAALTAATGQTLEILSLQTLDCSVEIFTGVNVTDMTGFKKLKELELDTAWLEWPPYIQFVRVDDYDIGPGPPQVPRLDDWLPPSNEKLQILAITSEESLYSVRSLFISFLTDQGTRLPNLTSVLLGLYETDVSWSCPVDIAALQHSGKMDIVTCWEDWYTEYEGAFVERFGLTL